MSRAVITLHIELLPEGMYLATSPEVPELIVQGETLAEAIDEAHEIADALWDSYIRNGLPVPPALEQHFEGSRELDISITVGR
ncbi:MAG: type II toxin-antitoxin system HicB family antitoxin [bacterium]